jgi:transposase InsO family protein
VKLQQVVHSIRIREADGDQTAVSEKEDRMDYHQNAQLTYLRREQLARKVVEQRCTLKLAAASFSVSARTAAKWVRRYRESGTAGLVDRSSRPHRMPRQTGFVFVERVLLLRRQCWTGMHIAQVTGLSRATVSRILRRNRLSRMRDLEPRTPVHRYEHKAPGDLLHLDIKKLGRFTAPGARAHGDPSRRTRGVGWDYVHVAIDDHSRIAFSAIHANEQGASAAAFLRAAVAHYAHLGIRIRRVLTDNGPAYHSLIFARACRELSVKHRFTRPYTPRTNGKAERFIQTALREWAYARLYHHSDHRNRDLLSWLHHYNWHRPHGGIGLATPITRSGLDRNNLLSLHK